jgi:DnaJ-class molecular chaperone
MSHFHANDPAFWATDTECWACDGSGLEGGAGSREADRWCPDCHGTGERTVDSRDRPRRWIPPEV